MNILSSPTPAHDPSASDDVFYDPDEVVPKNSPLVRPIKVNIRPSPSPSLELQASDDSAPASPPENGRKGLRASTKPNLGDVVLLGHLANNVRSDIALTAGISALPSGPPEDETQIARGFGVSALGAATGGGDKEADRERAARGGRFEPPPLGPENRRSMSIGTPPPAEEGPAGPTDRSSLQSLAHSALLAFTGHRAEISGNTSRAPTSLDIRRDHERERLSTPGPAAGPITGPLQGSVSAPGSASAPGPPAPGSAPLPTEVSPHRREIPLLDRERDVDRDMDRDDRALPSFYSAPSPYSPRSTSTYAHSPLQASLGTLHTASLRSPAALASRSELPPIQGATSPRSESNSNHGHNPLPSIHDLNLSTPFASQVAISPDGRHAPPPFPQSPPAAPPRLSAISHHGSPPPISPQDPFRRADLPSPAVHLSPPATSPSFYSPHAPPLQFHHGAANGYHHPRHSIDYSSSSATETPGSTGTGAGDLGASPPNSTSGLADHQPRSHIDGLTTTMGNYVCQFPGCSALPFQTQYLLNSHANVHSSERPHYCPVKGCPRSEGGKGFKRKNEMIRHGLVHDSPGYVCPFCPDREHKYPRPDNLQRHVRVHHMDKDKDDPQLRDVLAQRPDGPNRGRRRRHGPP